MGSAGQGGPPPPVVTWSLLSHHGLVAVYLAMNPNATLREMSQRFGLTERTLYGLVKDLVSVNILQVTKSGRRNVYSVNRDARLLHPMLAHLRLGPLLDVLRGG